jgi:deoxyribose-phosphate aldolase
MRQYRALIEQYEDELKVRVQRGEIVEKSKDRIMKNVSYVLEALLAGMPLKVVIAYCEEHGFSENVAATAERLKEIADERKR